MRRLPRRCAPNVIACNIDIWVKGAEEPQRVVSKRALILQTPGGTNSLLGLLPLFSCIHLHSPVIVLD